MTTNTIELTGPATRFHAEAAPIRTSIQTPSPTATALPTATPTALPTPAAVPAAPSIHRRLLLTWLAVYPTITVVQMLLGTSVAHLALPVRTLIVTGIVAPVVVYLALPQILKVDRRIARAWAARGR